jgi:hypothetical protein
MKSTAIEIRRPLNRKVPRNARALTQCRRGELAEGLPLGARPGAAFLRALRRFDADLEIYWHPILGRWILYRVVQRGATPAGDVLLKETVIHGPGGQLREPGWWLIERLRSWDKTQGGSMQHEYASRKYLEKMDREERAQTEAWDQKTEEISESFARECEKYALGNRRSQLVPKEYAKVAKR